MAAYRQALVHVPEDALALEAAAWASHLAPGERHSPKSERKTYDDLLRRDPAFLRARLHRAQLLWRRGEDRPAAAELAGILEVYAPPSAGVETARARFVAYLFRALILLDCHQFGAALADLWEAAQLRVSPQLERLVRFATGSCMLQVGDAVEARRDLSRLVEVLEAEAAAAAAEDATEPAAAQGRREPDRPLCLGAYFNLGLVEQRLGRPRSALRCFEAAQRQANALDLDTPAAAKAKGIHKGEPSQESQADARQRRMATEARVATHLAAAQALQALGRPSEAAAQYDAALRVQPNSQVALLCRGDFCFSAAKVADARRAYSRALHERPQAVAPRVAMARLLHHEGQLDAAWRMVNSALGIERRDPHALETRAVLKMSEADSDGALLDLHAALACASAPPRRSPPWAEWLCNRAALSVLCGDVRGAVADLRTAAVEARAGCPRALEGLGALAMRASQYAKAAALYDETLAALERQAPLLTMAVRRYYGYTYYGARAAGATRARLAAAHAALARLRLGRVEDLLSKGRPARHRRRRRRRRRRRHRAGGRARAGLPCPRGAGPRTARRGGRLRDGEAAGQGERSRLSSLCISAHAPAYLRRSTSSPHLPAPLPPPPPYRSSPGARAARRGGGAAAGLRADALQPRRAAPATRAVGAGRARPARLRRQAAARVGGVAAQAHRRRQAGGSGAHARGAHRLRQRAAAHRLLQRGVFLDAADAGGRAACRAASEADRPRSLRRSLRRTQAAAALLIYVTAFRTTGWF